MMGASPKVVRIICAHCGVAVMRSRWDAKRSTNNFCSKSCGAKFRGIPQPLPSAGGQARAAALRATELERFWAKVKRGASGECWEWAALRDPNGYGITRWRGRQTLAHRVALSLTDDLWSSKLSVCHSCDNPPCCNPAHLWRGTQRDNMRDASSKGRTKNPNGEASPVSRLTEKMVIAIRQSSDSQHTLARSYGVSRGAIASVKRRLTWRHVP